MPFMYSATTYAVHVLSNYIMPFMYSATTLCRSLHLEAFESLKVTWHFVKRSGMADFTVRHYTNQYAR